VSVRGLGESAIACAMIGAACIASAACGAPTRAAPLDPAGGKRDQGAGLLAQASVKLMTSPGDSRANGTGGESYGGAAYGGGAYGGPAPTSWAVGMPNRSPRYNVGENLHGVIEGAVTWTGAAPARVATKCGVIDDPSVRIGRDGGVGGVIVYIEHVRLGRPTPTFGRPVAVGGAITKHGCALYPAAQIISPVPSPVTIRGDRERAQLEVTTPGGARAQAELQEGGFVRIEAAPGVTRIGAADGAIASAWVIGVESPYYAITDDTGRFRLDELAPGDYELSFWQAPLAHVTGAVISYDAPTVVKRTVKVDLGKPAKISVALSRH
jgi:hypothetical protein